MDDLGFNKIAAAVLATALGFMGLKEISHALMHTEAPEAPAYALDIAETGDSGEEEIEIPFPSPAFIAAMDETKGEKVFKKCVSCHNADNGGKHSTGPNLWDIVGKPAGTKPDFGYTAAMTGAGLTWNYEELNDYLTKPTKYVKGTAMNFIGLKKEEDRAAAIEYLRVRAPNPMAPPVAAVVEPEIVPLDEETRVVDVPLDEGVPQEAPSENPEESPTETPVEEPEDQGSDQ